MPIHKEQQTNRPVEEKVDLILAVMKQPDDLRAIALGL